ncbi:MAG: type I 3-dehydroquinate dehydratase [Acidobacteria bacterium]|nr:MAG: type I 3-dehydroquinate dehydratase [Acidobacteriota bacterium]
MRPCVRRPLKIQSIEFGGPKPLFCVPLVATDLDSLLAQGDVARGLAPDLIEWRADSYGNQSGDALIEAAGRLRTAVREIPIIFTLRIKAEGGARLIDQGLRSSCIDAVLRSEYVDIVDLELSNGREFLKPLIDIAHKHGVSVVLSFHDFQKTGSHDDLLGTIRALVEAGADIAKIACIPQTPEDVLRMLEVTFAARKKFPNVPLCTMSMGKLGSITRTAGFLFGSDMAFAVGQEVSAPGQIPLADARTITEKLLSYA